MKLLLIFYTNIKKEKHFLKENIIKGQHSKYYVTQSNLNFFFSQKMSFE